MFGVHHVDLNRRTLKLVKFELGMFFVLLLSVCLSEVLHELMHCFSVCMKTCRYFCGFSVLFSALSDFFLSPSLDIVLCLTAHTSGHF